MNECVICNSAGTNVIANSQPSKT